MTPVAVVICTRDRPALLAAAIKALSLSMRPEDEVVVVDSASQDARACQPAHDAGIPIVRVERPGLSRARNAGVAATKAPLVAFTDDDCQPHPGWTAAIDAAFAESTTGFVTGSTLADRTTPIPVSVVVGDQPRSFGRDDDPFACGTGANMAFRRQAMAEVGPFDEVLGAGAALRAGEDIDMFWRLLRRGWAGRFQPAAVVTHQQWRTPGQAVRLGYGYGVGGGALAAKAIRLDGRAGWRILARRLGRDCVVQLGRDLAHGYRSGIAMDVLLAAGTIAGTLNGARLALDRRESCFRGTYGVGSPPSPA